MPSRLKRALVRLGRWLPGGRERMRQDIGAELEEHVARLTEDNLARGLSLEDARRTARLRFGNAAAIAERCQDERPPFRLEELVADVRFGLRLLARAPGFAVVAVATLGLGIGANSAIFSLVHGVLLKQLPFAEPERLVTARGFSVPDYEDLRAQVHSFDRTAIWGSNLYTVVTDGEAEQIPGIVCSPELLATLGLPLRGRLPLASEAEQPLLVLSHELWQSRFAGSDEALGRTLELGGRLYTVVGVMPPGFYFPSAQYKLWVTFGSALSAVPGQAQDRSLRIFRVLARLRPGVALDHASAELLAFSERQAQAYAVTNRDVRFELRPVLESMVGDTRKALLVLLGAVGLVLLIACANVASLLLARSASRQGELAMRRALGATRGRLVRQLLAESLVVSAVGGAAGLAIAHAALRWLRSWPAAPIPRLESVELDATVLAFTLALATLSGLAFGVLPALDASRAADSAALRGGGRTSSPCFGRRLRPALVALEIALSLVVTVGAGLLVRSLLSLTSVDPGFSPERLTTGMAVLIDVAAEERPRVVDAMLQEIARLPGVERAGAGTGLPPETAQRAARYELPGDAAGAEPQRAYFLAVTPDYLPALGTRLVAGRSFDARDAASAAKVVVVSERLARSRFGTWSPVGERIRIVTGGQSSEWREVIGVVADVRYSGLSDSDAPAIYTPYPQNPQLLGGVYLVVRTLVDDPALAAAIKRAVIAAAPGVHAVRLRPMSDVVRASVSGPRLNASLLSLFSLLALALAATGIYGLVSYAIAQRTYEIGVRIAMGALRADVARLVLRQLLPVVGAGLAAGLLGAVAGSRALGSLLFGVQPTDPLTFAAVALALVAVGLGASFVPLRRATRIDPVRALRYE